MKWSLPSPRNLEPWIWDSRAGRVFILQSSLSCPSPPLPPIRQESLLEHTVEGPTPAYRCGQTSPGWISTHVSALDCRGPWPLGYPPHTDVPWVFRQQKPPKLFPPPILYLTLWWFWLQSIKFQFVNSLFCSTLYNSYSAIWLINSCSLFCIICKFSV